MGTEILQKIEEPIKAALREFLDWYGQRYTMPIDIQLDAHKATIHIYYDVTEKIEECTISCVQQTKRILSREVDEERIKESCRDSCFVEVAAVVNARFDDIREAFKRLNNGIKYWWEEGWEDVYRYLVIHIQ